MKYRIDRLSANWDTQRREPIAQFKNISDAIFFVDAHQKAVAVSFCAYRIIDTVADKEYRVNEDGQHLQIQRPAA